jgi:hypothetical protein
LDRVETATEKEGKTQMGILGLTHDENGAALERLPVTIKVVSVFSADESGWGSSLATV